MGRNGFPIKALFYFLYGQALLLPRRISVWSCLCSNRSPRRRDFLTVPKGLFRGQIQRVPTKQSGLPSLGLVHGPSGKD